MSYQHLSTYERGCIETLYKLGYSNRKIALELGRHHSTIDRELTRNDAKTKYHAPKAYEAYTIRRKNSKPKGKYSNEIAVVIKEKLTATWSPEQIANTTLKGKVSFKTIYNWLYQNRLHKIDLSVLRQKGKRKNPVEKRGKFAIGTPISQRPKEVKARETFGHWELDTMVSSRGKSKGFFATFLERKSRLLPFNAFKTATTDRGKEFACFQSIQDKLGITLYFADPYSSWQRGSNENSNGLLREFYPKKTDLARVNEHELIKNLFLINSRPRKCLGWKSPIQVFLHEVAHLD